MGLLNDFTKKLIPNFLYTDSLRGKVGEFEVDNALNPLFFGKAEHRQINNLVIIDDNGKSHQIDHIEIRANRNKSKWNILYRNQKLQRTYIWQ